MDQILKKIKPNKEEQQKFKQITTEFLKKLNSKLVSAKAILGGSGIKDTWLSGNHDVDIFVQFDYQKFSKKSNQLSDILQPILKKKFPKLKIERLHGSRDYFQTSYRGLDFEIVPILKLTKSEQVVNITDISPLHSQWVNKHALGLKDDIRLAKQFCKANHLYGAESYINGFSGYVLEILTAYYGSFENVLKASLKWKNKEIIDFSKFYSKKMALFHINKSKLQSPLVIVDPVDKTRNVAAALSAEKWGQFKQLAAKYLKNPSPKLFKKEEVNFNNLKNINHHLLFLTLISLKGKEDVVGAKLLKVYNFLVREMKPFGIEKSGWGWDKRKNVTMYFLLLKKELPKHEIRSGPPLKMKEAVKLFKIKNNDTFMEKGKLFARIIVKSPKLEDFITDLLKDSYIKEKIKTVVKVEFN